MLKGQKTNITMPQLTKLKLCEEINGYHQISVPEMK